MGEDYTLGKVVFAVANERAHFFTLDARFLHPACRRAAKGFWKLSVAWFPVQFFLCMNDHGDLSILRVSGSSCSPAADTVALEEPLEIRVVFERGGQRVRRSVSVTMRTPGRDEELAAGFLFTEGLIHGRAEIDRITTDQEEGNPNVIEVRLKPGVTIELDRLNRNFYTTSSCGVCGKSSLAALQMQTIWPLPTAGPEVSFATIHALPGALHEVQAGFAETGGLHAAALFDMEGTLAVMREDVGRHNAVDKVIGSLLLADKLPAPAHGLFLSGRASFELMQKALMAGIPIVAAVGAPSSLAIETAQTFRATLLGFVRAGRFNIYSGPERVFQGRQSAGVPTQPPAKSLTH